MNQYRLSRDKIMRKTATFLSLLMLASLHAGCAPEVGSDAWCEDMADKAKGDWSTNEAKAFAENCIFKTYDEKERS